MVNGAIELDMPSSPRYVSLARLVTSALARGLNFSEEGVDDLKIVVSEMCTNAIIHCDLEREEAGRVYVKYIPGKDSITIEVQDHGQGFDPGCVGDFEDGREAGKGFGIPLIKSLVDEFELKSNKDQGTTIRVTKYEQLKPGSA